MTSSTDRIEKQIQLRAAPSRVWRALTHAQEFGAWFGVKLENELAPGARVTGHITHPGYEDLQISMTVEKIIPESFFSYFWHPYAVDPKMDYSRETPTRVEFHLQPSADGTLLTVIESGFDQVPLSRRIEAYRKNTEGWAAQLRNIERYVAAA